MILNIANRIPSRKRFASSSKLPSESDLGNFSVPKNTWAAVKKDKKPNLTKKIPRSRPNCTPYDVLIYSPNFVLSHGGRRPHAYTWKPKHRAKRDEEEKKKNVEKDSLRRSITIRANEKKERTKWRREPAVHTHTRRRMLKLNFVGPFCSQKREDCQGKKSK